MIVLVGFMGAGKTTVGRMLAERIGLPFIDTDQEIERVGGTTVADIFGSKGEGAFRTMERDAVERALAGPDAVVALGGGALGDPVTCSALEWHTVVHLDVAYGEAMRRIGHDAGRPMLHRSDPRRLFDDRRVVYERTATHTIPTTESSPEAVVDAIVAAAKLLVATGPARVHVNLGDRSYPIFIGSDIAGQVADLVAVDGARKAFVVTHPSLADLAKPAMDSFAGVGVEVNVLPVEEGESSKDLAVAGVLLEALAEHRATRSDLVIGFGGGVVCDLAGFVASTYHRGMRVIHIPTSLLAQVDAAIGGKTAVNLPRGKNLAGTFHQPLAVVCDVNLLRSLHDDEFRSGLAEVIKYGLIADPGLLETVSGSVPELFARDEVLLTGVVRRSAAIKAAIVSGDEHEQGRREMLNYGHTFGHGIEHVTQMRHGEAVSVGMMAAAHLAESLGMLDPDDIETHRRVLQSVGLPVAAQLDPAATVEALMQDKKHRDTPRLVLLDAIGSPRTGVAATEDQIVHAIRKVAT